LPREIGELTQRHHALDLTWEYGVKPTISVRDDGRIILVFVAATLAEDAVDERVEHDVTAGETQLRDETLDAVPSAADECPTRNDFVLSGVLPDHKEPCAPIESASMKHRPPLRAEVLRGKDGLVWHVLHKRRERLVTIARVE
jgi:hypothetical protein